MKRITRQVLFVILLLCITAAACTPATTPPPPTTIPINTTPMPLDKMVLIPAGAFSMGNSLDQAMAECKKFRDDCQPEWFAVEAPVHTVNVPAFYMDVYEVVNANYRACVTAGKCTPPRLNDSAKHPGYFQDAQYNNFPVIDVNWDQARTYCEWRKARLPTEAEWEKAARGTEGRTYPWGEGVDTTRANYSDSKIGDPTMVGSYENGKSPYGLYDMTGNVWEWVADWYDVYPGGDPKASTDFGQKFRGLRGGGWSDPANTIHAAYRGSLDPTHSFGNIGFRCASSSAP
ncbi:MAG: formylglycine-generating enzyme family protein [Anaerolineales bacterium]